MDTNSEQHRHECEVRAILAMHPDRRRGFLDIVGKRRGNDARIRLEGDVYRAWIERQVDGLMAMTWDDDRVSRLLRIQHSSNVRTRDDVERAMERRLAANDNNLREEKSA